MKPSKDTYKEVRVFQYGNATVRVHIPDLTPEERERRMNRIKDAAARLLYPEMFPDMTDQIRK